MHLRPFWDFGLNAAGEFLGRRVNCIKANRGELLSSLRLNHRLADLAMKQLDNGRRRVGGDQNARHRVRLLPGRPASAIVITSGSAGYASASSQPTRATFLP